jgi:hypothetical protein
LLILFKLIHGNLFKWGVRLNPDVGVLINELDRLHLRKIDKKPITSNNRLRRIFQRNQAVESQEAHEMLENGPVTSEPS